MVKKKPSIHTKKKKLHPLFIAILSMFAVVVIAIMVTAQVYKNTSPLEEVAGAATSSAQRATFPSITPTPKSCVAVGAVIGYAPCQKDSYKEVHVVCGDGSKPTLATNGQCQPLATWMTQIATVCTGHSSCQASPIHPPMPTISPRISGTPLRPSPHATQQ